MAPTTETASPIGIANVSHRVPESVYNGMRGTSANLSVSLAAQPTVCISVIATVEIEIEGTKEILTVVIKQTQDCC